MENKASTSITEIFTVKIKEEENLQNVDDVDNTFSNVTKTEFADPLYYGNEIKLEFENRNTGDLSYLENLHTKIKLEENKEDMLTEKSVLFGESVIQKSEELSTSTHLKQHEKLQGGERPFRCNICFQTFARLKDLSAHKRILHTGEKPFKCNTCFKTFSHLGHLKSHERIHTGEKPFSCNVCFKKFSYSSSLTEHKRIHTGEKPFICNICFKTFSRSTNLKLHERTHTGEKPFKCDVCFKTFSQSAHLKTHERIHEGKKIFKCGACLKIFSKLNNLRTHIKTLHTLEK